jgi:hypothetical protein
LLALALPPGASATVRGDFDADGFADLAVGVPGASPNGTRFAGDVHVIYGAPGGLSTAAGYQVLSQATPGVHDEPNRRDHFGEGLAAGDFDGDGFEDLAVGVPQESPRDGGRQIGLVQVFYGGPSGLEPTSEVTFRLSDLGVPMEDFTFFGQALTAGNFGKSAQDDLAIVSPGFGGTPRLAVIYGGAAGLTTSGPFVATSAQLGFFPSQFSSLAAANFGSSSEADLAVGLPQASQSVSNAGAVGVLYGAPGGLSTTSVQLWQQGAAGLSGALQNGDAFGTALAARNLDDEPRAELAIGVPGQIVHGHPKAGAVQVLRGGPGGLTATGNRIWTRDNAGVEGDATDYAGFGTALAANLFGRSSFGDLAIGAPGAGPTRAGQVNVLYGSAHGPTTVDDQLWDQDSPGIPGTNGVQGDSFGDELASGHFGGTGTPVADLAVGVPHEPNTVNGILGAVNVIYGTDTGLAATGAQRFVEGRSGIQTDQGQFGLELGPPGG